MPSTIIIAYAVFCVVISYIMGIYILRSFGMAFIMMPIMTAGMNALPKNKISHGTAHKIRFAR